MVDWKTFKGEGPWPFGKQFDKWGYLNNPRWTAQKAHLNQHSPCGHWHSGPYSSLQIVTYDHWWWQPGVDVFADIIGMSPHYYDATPEDGVLGLVYDIPSDTWRSRGDYKCMMLYAEPYTTRLTSTRLYVFGSIWAYDWWGMPGDPEYNKYYLALIRFRQNHEPDRIDVWAANYSTGTPYDVDEYAYENAMDAMSDRVVCAALVYKINGVAYNKGMIKVSYNNGDSFPTEWSFTDSITTPGTGGYKDCIQVRMAVDGTCFLLYVRSRSQATRNSKVEVWKSNAGCTSFSKIYEYDYYADLGNHVVNGKYAIFDVSESGNYITIILNYTSGYTTAQLVIASTNGGSSFTEWTNNFGTVSFGRGKSNGEYSIAHAGKATGQVFMRSDDYSASFDEVAAPAGVDGYFPDIQRYYNKVAYVECSEDFGVESNRQGVLYSEDMGLTWRAIATPAAVVADLVTIVTVETWAEEPQVWSLP